MNDPKLQLQDFCDMDSLYSILDDWSVCTGLSAIVVGTDGSPISRSFGMSPFCKMIQDTEEGKSRCKDNWKQKNWGIHQCHAGFYDFAVLLKLPDGTDLGRVLAGQMFSSEQTKDEILKKIDGIGLEKEAVVQVLNSVPRKTVSEMEGSYNLLKQMVDFFIEKSYANYLEKKARNQEKIILSVALNTVYRMSMYFNVTKNFYHIIDFNTGVSEMVPLDGTIDQIVVIGSSLIPDDEHAFEYRKLFNRQALISAYNSGVKELKLRYRQKIFNGDVHWMEGRLLFVKYNEYIQKYHSEVDLGLDDNDIHAICLERIVDDEVRNEMILNEALETSRKQQSLLQEALDNYKQADYDRRRDFLTGLRNRQDMFELFNDALSGKRSKIKSMFMMDIDNFKNLNDKYGHTYGDDCLIKIGNALDSYGMDNNIYFYRYGGEEMLGISFGNHKPEVQIAEELVKLVYDLKIERSDSEFGVVTVSLGFTNDNSRYEKMIDKADKAMYFAKQNGKNQAVCFENM